MTSSDRSRKAQVWIACRSEGSASVRVLLFRMIPENGGFWQPITGGVDPTETLLRGAARELHEESGLSVDESKLIDLSFSYRFKGRWGDAEEWTFLYPLDHEVTPVLDPKEHLSYEWVNVDEAYRRITFAEQHKALSLVVKYFSNQS